ncbi:UNVERIFIED_CONTAM: hypothetical protein FKN15_058441, partial [Acipenser sinensis]
SDQVKWHNMVWEVKTKPVPNSVQKVQLLVDKSVSGMDDTFEMLKCDEDPPSSPGYPPSENRMEYGMDDTFEMLKCDEDPPSTPGYPPSENRMEYDDLPELQAVQEDAASPKLFQLGAGLSHQERPRTIWNPHTSSSSDNAGSPNNGTNWLTELANIATSPQSPLMQCTFYNRESVEKQKSGRTDPVTEIKNTDSRSAKGASSENRGGDKALYVVYMKSFLFLCTSYDFTPLDSSAVYVLSSMARQRRVSHSSGGAISPDCEKSNPDFVPSSQPSCTFYNTSKKSNSSGTTSSATVNKCKRPMNAFMLFAKKYRVEYTKIYPGKDNRAISVILGDRWKKMKNEERRMYTMEAKALAEEQKRLNPDCWKRKRTNSLVKQVTLLYVK